MKAYGDIAGAISGEYGEEMAEISAILYKSAIAAFLFGFGIFSVYTLRDLLSGIGNAVVSSLLTSSIALFLLLLLVDIIIGLTREEVINNDVDPEISYSRFGYDVVKSTFSFITGSFAILVAAEMAPGGFADFSLRNLTVLRPIYEQMFSAGITLFGISLLVIGFYMSVVPILYMKVNFKELREGARGSTD